MLTTMNETFIADWQNYLYELGFVMTGDTDFETNEITLQAELTQVAIAQDQIDSTRLTLVKSYT